LSGPQVSAGRESLPEGWPEGRAITARSLFDR
jgi:hypothetical protein